MIRIPPWKGGGCHVAPPGLWTLGDVSIPTPGAGRPWLWTEAPPGPGDRATPIQGRPAD